MKDSITANDILAFVLEMAALVLLGLWAGSFAEAPIWRWTLFLLAAAIYAALWALFFAPKATLRLSMPWLLVGKLMMLLPPGLLYFQSRILFSAVWAALVLLHLIVGAVQKNL